MAQKKFCAQMFIAEIELKAEKLQIVNRRAVILMVNFVNVSLKKSRH